MGQKLSLPSPPQPHRLLEHALSSHDENVRYLPDFLIQSCGSSLTHYSISIATSARSWTISSVTMTASSESPGDSMITLSKHGFRVLMERYWQSFECLCVCDREYIRLSHDPWPHIPGLPDDRVLVSSPSLRRLEDSAETDYIACRQPNDERQNSALDLGQVCARCCSYAALLT
jgi:hypothetical protein